MKLHELRNIIKDEVIKILESKVSVSDNVPDESYVEPEKDDKKEDITNKENDKDGKRPENKNKTEYYEAEYLISPMIQVNGLGHYCEFDLACNLARKYKNMYGNDDSLQYVGVSGEGDKFAIMYITENFLNELKESDFSSKKYYNKFKECAKSYIDSKEDKEIIDSY